MLRRLVERRAAGNKGSGLTNTAWQRFVRKGLESDSRGMVGKELHIFVDVGALGTVAPVMSVVITNGNSAPAYGPGRTGATPGGGLYGAPRAVTGMLLP